MPESLLFAAIEPYICLDKLKIRHHDSSTI